MFLLKQNGKGKSLCHPLGGICGQPVEEAFPALKAGNTEPMILGHIRLAIYIASKYAARVPNKSDDLVSEAILALVKACNDIATGELELRDENITSFLTVKIHSKISDFISRDYTISIPPSTLRTAKAEGRTIQQVSTFNLNLDSLTAKQNSIKVFDILDTLETITKTPAEKQIVNLRIKYYDDNEISEKLGMKVSKVREIRKSIKEKYYE